MDERVGRLERVTAEYLRAGDAAVVDGLQRAVAGEGAYVPPQMAVAAVVPGMPLRLPGAGSAALQRLHWEALRRALQGAANRATAHSLPHVLREVLAENVVRGRGLLCRALVGGAASAPALAHVYAALGAGVSAALPAFGRLLVSRCVLLFRRAYAADNRADVEASTLLLSRLCAVRVAHPIVLLQIVALLLSRPSADSVELAARLARDLGPLLCAEHPGAAGVVFARVRDVLQRAPDAIGRRGQCAAERVLDERRAGWPSARAVPCVDVPSVLRAVFGDRLVAGEQLDYGASTSGGSDAPLEGGPGGSSSNTAASSKADYTLPTTGRVAPVVHVVQLDDDLDADDAADEFAPDASFAAAEAAYAAFRRSILGEAEPGDGDYESDTQQQEPTIQSPDDAPTPAEVTALRKRVYLTVMASLDDADACHRLLGLGVLAPGLRAELVRVLFECCAAERTYVPLYGRLAARLSRAQRGAWRPHVEAAIAELYARADDMAAPRLRAAGPLLGHLLAADAVSWAVLGAARLAPGACSAAQRVLLRHVFVPLAAALGAPVLAARLARDDLARFLAGVFPRAARGAPPEALRYAAAFYAAIGLGAVAQPIRDDLLSLEGASSGAPAVVSDLDSGVDDSGEERPPDENTALAEGGVQTGGGERGPGGAAADAPGTEQDEERLRTRLRAQMHSARADKSADSRPPGAQNGRSPGGHHSRSPGGHHSRSPGGHHSRSPDTQNGRLSDSRYSRSPGRHHSRSPDNRYSRRHDTRHSRSPDTRHSRSPGGHYSRSPDSRHSRSPDTQHTRSPDTRHRRSPGRHHSRSPDARHRSIQPPRRPRSRSRERFLRSRRLDERFADRRRGAG